jgi:bifunctional non-homologous end joining protein LigD
VSGLEVGGRRFEVSNLDKVLFPGEAITKGDVIDYYRRIADRMLPHLRDRLLVMRRFPDGIDEEGFFQKHAADYFPSWIRTRVIDKLEGGTVEHVVCDEPATLVYLAQLGAIELHTLLAPAATPETPDRIVVDLDPPPDGTSLVIDAVRSVRRMLSDLDVTGFVCSTGSRGAHVHVLVADADGFDATRALARRLAEVLVAAAPDVLTLEARRGARGRRLYLDVQRNGYGQHVIAPYSLRALPGAPVAVPLTWDEATASSYDPRRVRIDGVLRHLAAEDEDPWSGMGRHRYSLAALEERVEGYR